MSDKIAQAVSLLAFLSVHAIAIVACIKFGPTGAVACYYLFIVGVCLQGWFDDKERLSRAEHDRAEAAARREPEHFSHRAD